MRRFLRTVALAALAVALGFVLNRNLLGLGEPGQFENFQTDAERMVENRLIAARAEGVFSQGGFLLDTNETAGVIEPYRSRTGIQGQLFALAYLWSGADRAKFTSVVRLLLSVALAGTLILFCATVKREFGTLAAAIALALIALSNYITFFSASTYWVIFSHFLPMAISFLLYPRVMDGRMKRRSFLLAIGSLIFVKALLGYEYTTNVIVSVTVPMLYFGIVERQKPRDILRQVAVTGGVGMAGLAAAIVVHTIQLSVFYGSVQLAIAKFAERAALRSVGNPDIHHGLLMKIARNTYRYFGVDIFTMVRLHGEMRFGVPMYGLNLAVLFGLVFSLADERHIPAVAAARRKLLALCAACGWGLAGSLTWFFVAIDHTYGHLHMNPIMFYLPYGLLVYTLVAAGTSIVIQQLLAWLRKTESVDGRAADWAPVPERTTLAS